MTFSLIITSLNINEGNNELRKNFFFLIQIAFEKNVLKVKDIEKKLIKIINSISILIMNY
jgi:hypothetical protein